MTESDERLSLPHASAWRRYELCGGSWQLEQEAKRLGQAAHGASPVAKRGVLRFWRANPMKMAKRLS
jgi:hypothetical protein